MEAIIEIIENGYLITINNKVTYIRDKEDISTNLLEKAKDEIFSKVRKLDNKIYPGVIKRIKIEIQDIKTTELK
jgi:gas vesicle protein